MVIFHSYVNLPEGKPKFIDWWIIIFSSKSWRILGGVFTIFRQTRRKPISRGFMLAVARDFRMIGSGTSAPFALHLQWHCIWDTISINMYIEIPLRYQYHICNPWFIDIPYVYISYIHLWDIYNGRHISSYIVPLLATISARWPHALQLFESLHHLVLRADAISRGSALSGCALGRQWRKALWLLAQRGGQWLGPGPGIINGYNYGSKPL